MKKEGAIGEIRARNGSSALTQKMRKRLPLHVIILEDRIPIYYRRNLLSKIENTKIVIVIQLIAAVLFLFLFVHLRRYKPAARRCVK
jgi:hypothetical protein